jgi:hypothetical protein
MSSFKTSVFYQKTHRILESYLSVIPIILCTSVVYFTHIIPDFTLQGYVGFLISAFAIGLGLWLFCLGADNSISRMGTLMGTSLFRYKNIFFISIMTFVLGVIITIAEPDLRILAVQTHWNEVLLIGAVSLGVGLFFLFGVIRILFHQNLQVMFLAFYGLIFALTGLINPKFLPLSFDSGAVVTGPLTIPFILSFGAGLALSGNSRNGEDAFGLTALATAGPIFSVMVLSLFADPNTLVYAYSPSTLASAASWGEFQSAFTSALSQELIGQGKGILLAILPIVVFFFLYDILFLKLHAKERLKIVVSLFYSLVGLWVFLVAVNVGFLPTAQKIGYGLGEKSSLFPYAILLGGLFGLFGVYAEPAVHVLVQQIEKVSEGAIKAKTILLVMALSVGVGMALQIVRAIYGFSLLYYFLPLYFLALALSFVVPKIYANIAFDSGSIASGPMAASFVMPFVVGFTCSSSGSDMVYTSAFGTIAMVSAMPLVVIQLLGLYAEIKRKIIFKRIRQQFLEPDDCQVIHFAPR